MILGHKYPRRLFLVFILLALSILLTDSCRENHTPPDGSTDPAPSLPESTTPSDPAQTTWIADPCQWPRPRTNERLPERRRMVGHLRDAYRFDDPTVLDALLNVPRHWFTRRESRLAYADTPLPIGYDQTISQPYIVAYMTALLDLTPQKKVLEIGTGSGYQAAVLAELTPHVYTIEIVEPLARQTARLFRDRGYRTIRLKIGDGYLGWPEHQPFDAVIVTCAPDHIPPALLDQLAPSGRLVIPVGSVYDVQRLLLVTKSPDGRITQKSMMPVRFVPLTRSPDDNPS